MHARAIGVEDAHHLDAHTMLAVVVEHQRLGGALALVVAGARADRIHVAAIALGLRMHIGIAVHLAGAGVQDAGAHALGKPQTVDRTHDAGLHGLDRVVLVVPRRGRAGEVVDLVHLEAERIHHVVAHQLEVVAVEQVIHVALLAGEEVVEADHVVPFAHQPVAEVRTQESGAASDENPLQHFPKVADPAPRRRRARRRRWRHARTMGPWHDDRNQP